MPSRTVVLSWEGKEVALDALDRPTPPVEVVEVFDPARAHAPPLPSSEEAERPRLGGRIIEGDALDVARLLAEDGNGGRADLVYVDPPFDSGVDYEHEHRLAGSASGPVERNAAYGDRWDGPASYLDMLYPRLWALKPLLKPTGSIWVHVDWRANYYVRALCDEIFGRERFLNEIVWRRAPNLGRQARSGQFGRTLDTIIVYGAGPRARLVPPQRLQPIARSAVKLDEATGRHFTLAPRGDYTDASIERLDAEGRIHRTPNGNVYVRYWVEEVDGQLYRRAPIDSLWSDLPPLRHVSPLERTGYPTQKPRALLDRIIAAATPPGGLVIDVFAGSGTTGAAAAAAGRSFVLSDRSPVAIAVMRARLLREANVPLSIERCPRADAAPSPGAAATPVATLRAATSASRSDASPDRLAATGQALEFAAHRVSGSRVNVEVRSSPGLALLGWAVDIAPVPSEPFRAHWHTERGTGRHPVEVASVVDLAVAPDTRTLAARAYFADGSVRSELLEIAAEVAPSPEKSHFAEHPGLRAADSAEGGRDLR